MQQRFYVAFKAYIIYDLAFHRKFADPWYRLVFPFQFWP